MTINWQNIKYLFQIPLAWFKSISDRVFHAYGSNFIVVKEGDEGGTEIGVDEQLFQQMVYEYSSSISSGVKSVDNILPDENGNVELSGYVRAISTDYPSTSYTPDSNGIVDLGMVGKVRSVNSIVPDNTGNVNIGNIISGVDHVTQSNFGILELNAIRTINNKLSTDFNHNYNVNGVVLCVNGIQPDSEGNLSLAIPHSSVQNLISYGTTLYPDQQGNLTLPNFIMTVNGNSPDNTGNVEISVASGAVESVNDILPDENGNVDLGDIVYSVNGNYPDENGDVSVDIESAVQEAINDGRIIISSIVKSVNNNYPDQNGNVNISAVESVQGIYPVNGNVDFGLAGSKWVTTDVYGNLTTSNQNPVVMTSSDNGYLYAIDGVISCKDEEYVDLSNNQEVSGLKTWNDTATFKDTIIARDSDLSSNSIIQGSHFTATGSIPSISLYNTQNSYSTISRTSLYGTSIQDNDKVTIHAPADGALLANHPTGIYPYAIATVGFTIDVVNNELSNYSLSGYALKSDMNQNTDDGYLGYKKALTSWVTIATDQTITGQKTFSSATTHDANLYVRDNAVVVQNTQNQYLMGQMDPSGIRTQALYLHNPGAAFQYVGQFGTRWEDGSTLLAGDYGLTIYSPLKVNIDTQTNTATLQRSPDAYAPDNAIATVGWAKNTLLNGYDSTFDVVTNVIWDGNTLLFSKRTLTYQNGILKTVSDETDVTIDTPVAY